MTMPAKIAPSNLKKTGLPVMVERAEPFPVTKVERRRAIAASSVGTIFEWYDFYLYAVLAPFFAGLFFPPGNETAALLAAFAAYAAGFIVRPLGALFFGRLGDLEGRKYAFLVSIIFMGFATFTVGLLPTFEQAGWLAPILLVTLRLLQGLALGGEYGGAAIYAAEYTPVRRRGYATSFVQATPTSGLLLALIVIGLCRWQIPAADFERWGWRIPFLVSILLLAFSISIRIRLRETPVFLRMKAEGRASQNPVSESFFRLPNIKYIVLSVLGVTAGQGVVWYTGQLYTLFFLTITLHLDYLTAYFLVGAALAAGLPFFIFFGWLSDKIGRLKTILLGCLLAAASYGPLFHILSSAINPALAEFQAANPITLRADQAECSVTVFARPWPALSLCNQASAFLTKSGLSFTSVNAPGSKSVLVSIGDQNVDISSTADGAVDAILQRALFAAGYPGLTLKYRDGRPQTDARGNPLFERKSADLARIDYAKALGVLFAMMLYATMVYGPIAAFLVELFPPKVRYTSLSFPYHIGNGVFGGLLPLIATAIAAETGNVYAGLWYPVSVAGLTFIVGSLFLGKRRRHE